MKKRLLNYILRNLFQAITIDDIVSNDKKTGVLLVDGKSLQPNELNQLQAEIKAMEGFRVWELMSKTTKHLAEEKIFTKSVKMEDTWFGKAMLYNLSLQKSILVALKNKTL